MECSPQTIGTIIIDGQNLKKVVALNISADGDSLPDAHAHVNTAWLKCHQVTSFLSLYGSECWPASIKHQQALHTMEMRMLRWSLGLDQVMNEDVQKVLGVAPIIEKMREAHLHWYGHVVRRGEESVARRALRLSPDGQQPHGQPKKRWMDRIKEDIKQINAAQRTPWTRSKE